MKNSKILLTLLSISTWFYSYCSADFFDAVVDRLDTFWGVASSILTFIASAVKFLVKTITTLFSYLWGAFRDIFWNDFVWYLSMFFDDIAKYMGGVYWVIFVTLFLIAFMIMIFWFIMRVLKWNINYNASLKKLSKQSSKK